MLQIVGLIVVVAIVAFVWRQMARKKLPHLATVAGRAANRTYHCVEIRRGTHACKAVQSLGSTRFLSDEAPRLPVPGCTAAQCTCSFIHHDDRRDDDRRNPYGQFANLPPFITGERRSRIERRKPQEGSFRPSIAS